MSHRVRFVLGILIPTVFAIAFAAAWIAATGTFRPPLWALFTTSAGLGIVSYAIESVTQARHRKPRGRPRRAHARTTPTQTRKDTPAA